jgi:putative phage-type endonuclease
VTPALVTPTAYQVCGPRLEVTNRARWLALRREGIGGSDAPSVAALGGYSTRWQVWLDKTGQVPDEDPDMTDDQREWIQFGHDMEGTIARIWHRRMGGKGKLARAGMLAHAQRPWQRVNLDRLVTGLCDDGPCLLECKNRSAWKAAEWGVSDDPDTAPDGPVIQVQHALMVTGYSHGHLAAVIGGNSLRYFRIDADPVLQKTLLEEETWFWFDHVLPQVPPPIDATERTGKLLARLWDADPDLIQVATPEMVANVEALRHRDRQARELKTELAQRKHEIEQFMGDAEVLTDPGSGKPIATWKRNGTFASTRFAEEEPAVASGYEVPAVTYDTKKLAESDPATYRRFRARVFRLPAERST